MGGNLLILDLFVVASGTLSCMCSMADWYCELDCKQSGTFSRHDSMYLGCFQTSPLRVVANLESGSWYLTSWSVNSHFVNLHCYSGHYQPQVTVELTSNYHKLNLGLSLSV